MYTCMHIHMDGCSISECKERDLNQNGECYLCSGGSSLFKALEVLWESKVLFSLDDGKIRLVGISLNNMFLASLMRGLWIINDSWSLVFNGNRVSMVTYIAILQLPWTFLYRVIISLKLWVRGFIPFYSFIQIARNAIILFLNLENICYLTYTCGMADNSCPAFYII